jgi:hypothetical protein
MNLKQKAIIALEKEGFNMDNLSEEKKNFFIHGFMVGYLAKSKEELYDLSKLQKNIES